MREGDKAKQAKIGYNPNCCPTAYEGCDSSPTCGGERNKTTLR